LAESVFSALGLQPEIHFIDTPPDIRDKYQYYTQANMQKLVTAGYKKPFTTLETGVEDYVRNYLNNDVCF
jgi:ADP-L-glycero-D-manno-heptose 6-epimerase